MRKLFQRWSLALWEPRAVWDDFKLGLKIGFNIDKVAIYGDQKWQELAAKIGNWFISGEMKFFLMTNQL